MHYDTLKLPAFELVGITMRTLNENELKTPKIPDLWERFINENIIEQIPHKLEPSVTYGLYTDYESDEHGEYTLLIGAKTENVNSPENNLEKRDVPAATYAVFKLDHPSQVLKAWMKIWNMPLKRTYTGDFEQYNNETGKTRIYIAIEE